MKVSGAKWKHLLTQDKVLPRPTLASLLVCTISGFDFGIEMHCILNMVDVFSLSLHVQETIQSFLLGTLVA